MCSACCRRRTERPRSPWWRVGSARAPVGVASTNAHAASAAPARRRAEEISGGMSCPLRAYEVSCRARTRRVPGATPPGGGDSPHDRISGRSGSPDPRPRRAWGLGAKRASTYTSRFLLFAGSLADCRNRTARLRAREGVAKRGSAADEVAGLGTGEPAPPLVDDRAVLLEAEQQQAHVAAAEADALGELRGGEAGLVLERPGDEADAVEHARGSGAGERGHHASRACTCEQLRPGAYGTGHEARTCPARRETMHDLAGPLDRCAYSLTFSTRNEMRTCARHSPRPSPRRPVETTSTALMLRNERCASASAWRTASSELSVEPPTSSMIFVTAMVRTYRDHGNGPPR